ncbi:MAG: tRNA-dihydrouridine synthase family protein [Bdellovibrionales bacterium]|nr:tRNA-dihydrouridine synthase family protein [Bdellovibrionales bacterium]
MHSSAGPPLIQLAPMEGVLDWVLREQLSAIGGVDRMVTEFVRVTDKLLPDHVFRRYCPELEQGGKTRAGTPVFVQLLGGQSGPMAENAARVAALGAPGIDINFGCPAKTVNRHDGGAALLQKPERLYEVTKAIRAALPAEIPVTAKVRLGFDHKEFHREIAAAVDEAGASHIVVHARTKKEMYQPPAHWEYIARMKVGRRLPFLANGEIWGVSDYHACALASGVERVALGRGLVRRPTLAHEIRAEILGVTASYDFEPLQFLTEFFASTLAYRGEAYAVARLKQMLRYWAAADATAALWFAQAKLFTQATQAQDFLRERIRESKCLPLPFTPASPTALSANAPRLC